ncbi:hypothetical protein E3N88_06864 [Mikania micrantha]|uniref:Uncharacterized protein n=1 Tax=Mikania micrantha TaxID=192012 RepID=A0A5N6PPZ1_9ASTR|nr:hypothetical protein E3N88_06864 [Mikania micrantha]
MFLGAKEAADHIIYNSTIDLEPGTFTLFPKMLPIGPLLATNRSKRQVGHFWSEDSSCLTWLDQQPVCSVIYNWHSWESGQLGTSTGGPKPSVGGLLHESLWLELYNGRVSNGVRFLCWPYFAEQYFNKTYICDIWKTGIGLNKDDADIVTREEIKIKVEELLNNNKIKENAFILQETVTNSLQEGNSSNKKF